MLLAFGVCASWPVAAADAQAPADECLRRLSANAPATVTVGEVRARCGVSVDSDSAVEHRLRLERATRDNPFVLTPHRPNYILVLAHNIRPVNLEPFEETFGEQFGEPGAKPSRNEAAFQISLKFALASDLLRTGDGFHFGYTMRSFWQLYAPDELSSPFREYNHEPELWYSFPAERVAPGYGLKLLAAGINHQSNGQAGVLSRSWNRVYLQAVAERGSYTGGLRVWARLKEPADSDDNPDIERYLGHFEWLNLYRVEANRFGLMLRNNLRAGDANRGAFQLDWSFPATRRVRGYLQWFVGYGESLIDYDARVNRVGIGVALTDWL